MVDWTASYWHMIEAKHGLPGLSAAVSESAKVAATMYKAGQSSVTSLMPIILVLQPGEAGAPP